LKQQKIIWTQIRESDEQWRYFFAIFNRPGHLEGSGVDHRFLAIVPAQWLLKKRTQALLKLAE